MLSLVDALIQFDYLLWVLSNGDELWYDFSRGSMSMESLPDLNSIASDKLFTE